MTSLICADRYADADLMPALRNHVAESAIQAYIIRNGDDERILTILFVGRPNLENSIRLIEKQLSQ